MSHSVSLPTMCCLTKEETLANFLSPMNLPELVLENDPFPGYYSVLNIPEKLVPNFTKSLFLPTSSLGMCHLFEMMRRIHRVMEKYTFKIDPCPAVINYKNLNHYALRLKYYDVDILPELILAFQKEGVEFLSKKKSEPFQSVINLYKFVEMEPITETILVDAKNRDIDYILMPKTTEWDHFKKVITAVKNNTNLPMFDAAMCSVLTPNKELQFVRIYRQGGYPINDLKLMEQKIEMFNTVVPIV